MGLPEVTTVPVFPPFAAPGTEDPASPESGTLSHSVAPTSWFYRLEGEGFGRRGKACSQLRLGWRPVVRVVVEWALGLFVTGSVVVVG